MDPLSDELLDALLVALAHGDGVKNVWLAVGDSLALLVADRDGRELMVGDADCSV